MSDPRSTLTGFHIYKNDDELLKAYQHRLNRSEEKFQDFKTKGDELISRYNNDGRGEATTPAGHTINVTTGTGIIDALFSSLTAVEVDITVEDVGDGDADQASISEQALKYEWRRNRVNEKTGDAVKDALIVGLGWVKVGYEFEQQVTQRLRAAADIKQTIVDMAQVAMSEGRQLDENDLAAVPLEENVPITLKDSVVVDYVPWDQVRFDDTAKRPEDITWFAQLQYMTPQEVKDNPQFREFVKRSNGGPGQKVLEDIAADTTIDMGAVSTVDNVKDAAADDQRCTVVTFYDFKAGVVCTFLKDKDYLLNKSMNPLMVNPELQDRNPFVPLILRTSMRSVIGISDMALLERSLAELDRYRSSLATYVERFVPKVGGPEGALTEAGADALRSPEYGEYVEFSQGVTANDLKELNPPPLPSEVFGLPDRIENSMREATGVNELMRGLFPDRKRTATETSSVVSASAARQAEKRNRLEQHFLEIARRMLMFMQMFYTADRIVRLVEHDADVVWDYNSDDLVMDANLTIALTPKEDTTAQTRQDKATILMNMLGADQTGTVDMVGVYTEALKLMGFRMEMIRKVLKLPAEQQVDKMSQLQDAAAQADAQNQGVPRPDMVGGPLGPAELAAATNAGGIPPEVAIAAQSLSPTAPGAAEQVSESQGGVPG